MWWIVEKNSGNIFQLLSVLDGPLQLFRSRILSQLQSFHMCRQRDSFPLAYRAGLLLCFSYVSKIQQSVFFSSSFASWICFRMQSFFYFSCGGLCSIFFLAILLSMKLHLFRRILIHSWCYVRRTLSFLPFDDNIVLDSLQFGLLG